MALTITKNLDRLNPVRNEVRFGVTTPAYLTSAGTACEAVFYFNSGDIPVNDDILSFLLEGWDSYFSFTFRTTPNPAVAFKHVITYAASGAATLAEYISDFLIPALDANYYLHTRFIIEYATSGGNHGFKLTAREVGFDNGLNDILATGFAAAGGGIISGTDDVTASNFSLVFQLWAEMVNESDEYTMVYESQFAPNRDGYAEDEVSEVLRTLVEPTMPEPDMSAPVNMRDSWKRFYMFVAERYGDDPKALFFTERSSVVRAYLAGRNEVDRVNETDWENDVCPPHGTMRFLTAWPNTDMPNAKRVTPGQREYLCWVQRQNVSPTMTEANIVVDLHYDDGTSELGHVTGTIGFLTPEQRMCMAAVGVEHRALQDVNPDRTILWYRAYLTDQDGTERSESRYFVVDYRHHANYRQLHYFNSQGGVDTLALLGERVNKPTADVTESKRTKVGPSNILDARDTVITMRSIDDAFEVAIAYLTLPELAAVKDLPGSERIIERVGSEHWPVALLDFKGVPSDEGDGKSSHVLRYRYALTDRAVS